MSKILVVDDSPTERALIGVLLRAAPELEVRFATDGAEALAELEQFSPDLVVTDLCMPEVDGLQLISEMKVTHPRIPIILITAMGSEEIAVEALQHGAASYVPKSALNHRLCDTIENILLFAGEARSQLRVLGSLVKNELEFVLENDLTLIPPLVKHLGNACQELELCDDTERVRISVALEEALNNALVHGNLELTSSLAEGNATELEQHVEGRRNTQPYGGRKIYLLATLTRQAGTFVIRDEGPGFDVAANMATDGSHRMQKVGRGLSLMRAFMDEVAFNPTGNCVTLVKRSGS